MSVIIIWNLVLGKLYNNSCSNEPGVLVCYSCLLCSVEKGLHCGHFVFFVSKGQPLPSGDFATTDMVALGVSLAVALLICFVVIGFLAYHLSRFSTDWKKLSEASIFRSSVSRLNRQ